jgi:hypothetical protein
MVFPFVDGIRTLVRSRRWIPVLLVLLVMPAIARAQAVTGAIGGRLVSAQGEPLENATAIVSGPFLQGTRIVKTNARGYFQFPSVPPGEYEVRLTYIGYRPVVIQRVVVDLARMAGLETVVMTPLPTELQPVVVTAQVITIDPVYTTVGGTLNATDYARLPVDRDYKSLLRILPHANESTRGDPINVAGSTGLENQYYIDGVNVTDTRYASRATSLPYNFVRAVEVKTGGYEAMYGRALGAVVNAITYSGTNNFEANVFSFVQPSVLAFSPRVAPAITESGAVSYDVGVRVSGPVMRDRLWYSAALNPRVDRVDKEMTGFGFFRDRTTALRFAGKLTWQASATTGIELSLFGDPSTRDAVDPARSGYTSVASPDALLNRQTSGGVIGSIRATVTPTPSLLLETSVSRQRDRSSVEGATALGRSAEAIYDDVTRSIGGGYGSYQRDTRGRTSLMARGTLTSVAHTVVAGAEYEDGVVASAYDYTGVGVIYRLDTALYMTDHQGENGRVHNRSPAAYLQDSWRLTDRFTLNAGLRWSGQFFTGASGRVAQRITAEWQPRAGFSWQVGRLGTQRFFGSYGRVYETLPNNLAVLWFVDLPWSTHYYSSDPRQPGVVADSGQVVTKTEAEAAVSIPGLHGDNFDEFTLGYERMLGAGHRLSVRGLYRHLRSTYQWGWDFSRTPSWALGTPGTGTFDFLPKSRRDHTAIEVSSEGVWRGVRYRASYVLSRTWGNYPGLYSSDRMDGANPGANMALWFAEQAPNSSGLLPNDRTHVFKLSGARTFGFGFEGGAFISAESGSPINEFAASNFGALIPVFVSPRGTAGRTPALWTVDLRLAYALPLQRGPGSRVVLDVLSLGNPRRATRVDEMHYTTMDHAASLNPQYKKPVAYQAPMAVRLGVEISF